MAHEEGLRRIRLTAKVLMLTGCTLLLISAAVYVRLILLDIHSVAPLFLMSGALGLYSSVLGGIIFVGAWILEGFARPSAPPAP